MVDRVKEVTSRELYAKARESIRNHVLDFAASLVLESELVSFRKKDEIVISSHVEEAYANLLRAPPQSRVRQWMTIVGGVLLGGLVLMVNELAMPSPNAWSVGSYAICGVIGLLLVTFGVGKQ